MYPSSPRNPNIPLILLVVGIIFILLGVVMYFIQKIPSNYVKTTGTVVSLKTENVRQPGKTNQYTLTYFPVVSFTVNGNTYQFNGSGETYYPDPSPVGQKVSVSYNPSDPSGSPRLSNDKGPIIFGSIISGIGLVICLVSLIIFSKSRRTAS